MVTTQVEALPCEHFITGYSHGLLRPVSGNCETLFDRLIRIGVTQHYALARGNYMKEIEALAEMIGFDFAAL